MVQSLRHLQPLRVYPRTLPSAYYNRIRLASLRSDAPLRLELSQLGVVDAILLPDTWLCVDTSADDQVLIAWSDFSPGERRALDEPVPCKLYTFHHHAGLIITPALDALYECTAPPGHRNGGVVAFDTGRLKDD